MSTGLTFQKYLMSGRRSFTVVPKEPHPIELTRIPLAACHALSAQKQVRFVVRSDVQAALELATSLARGHSNSKIDRNHDSPCTPLNIPKGHEMWLKDSARASGPDKRLACHKVDSESIEMAEEEQYLASTGSRLFMRHALEIAVIDDDEMTRALIADILGRIDGTILCFNNASHALEYINADVPDILISDIDMPEKSGLPLLYKVKKEGS